MVQCEVPGVTGGWPAAGRNIASDAARTTGDADGVMRIEEGGSKTWGHCVA